MGHIPHLYPEGTRQLHHPERHHHRKQCSKTGTGSLTPHRGRSCPGTELPSSGQSGYRLYRYSQTNRSPSTTATSREPPISSSVLARHGLRIVRFTARQTATLQLPPALLVRNTAMSSTSASLLPMPGVDKVYLGRPWRPYAKHPLHELRDGQPHHILKDGTTGATRSNEETAELQRIQQPWSRCIQPRAA